MDISEEGRAKLENSTGSAKKAGETSTREEWEDNAAKLKRSSLYNADGSYNLTEVMRLDEPDTYAKCMSTGWFQIPAWGAGQLWIV